MNRRNAIKAAIGGIAAACGLKATKEPFQAVTLHAKPLEMQVASKYVEIFNYGTVSINDIRRWYRIPDGMI